MKLFVCCLLTTILLSGADDDFLHWNLKQAQSIALAARVTGKISSGADFRGLHTERSINYKLRATWLTPEVIRASSRIAQLRKSLTGEDARKMVSVGEAAGDTIVLVEIDPNEGSGVIPSSWSATLAPFSRSGNSVQNVRGLSTPSLSALPGLAGGATRDYDYDVFWVVFPLQTSTGSELFDAKSLEAELTVQIDGKTGRVRWPVPESIRAKRRAALAR